MKNLILFVLFLTTTAANAGKTGHSTVTGKITDVNAAPVPYANVLLLNAADSVLVKGSTTDDNGTYVIEEVESGTYLVMASFIGYNKVYGEVFTVGETASEIKQPELILTASAETLDEVSVVAKKPFIERKLDKIIVNVENSIVSAGNTALEVLKRSPGVVVDKDGNVSLKGKSGVMFMIDGKQSYLSAQDLTNMLKTMPADQIERIEIMTNPSAKYDAAGNAGIINIVMKKNTALGLNGSASVAYLQGFYPKENAGINANYRLEKWNFFASYNRNEYKGHNTFDITRNFRTNDVLESVFDQQSGGSNSSKTNTGKIGIDFFANKKHTFGVFINGSQSSGLDLGSNITLITDPSSSLMSGSHTTSTNKDSWSNISGNFNYNFKIDTTGKELSFMADYAVFTSRTNQFYDTRYFDSAYQYVGTPYLLESQLPSDINIFSSRLDYTHPIGKKIRVESGLKSSYVTTDNNAQFWNVSNGDRLVDSTKTNHFKYTENINAGYLNYLMEVNSKFSFQLGLRAEQTVSKGEQITTDSVFTRNYLRFFPSGFLTYKLSDKHELAFTYSRRINRPNYQDLNPFLYFLDPYTYMQGNTLLTPEYTNNFEFTHTFMGFLSTTLGYSKTTDIITQVTSQVDSTRTTFATNKNLNSLENFSLSTMLPIPIGKKWMSINYLTGFYNHYQGTIQDSAFDKGVGSWMIHSQNMFTFKKGWSAEISAFYMSKQVYGIFLMKPMSDVTIGIQKTFSKDRGTIKVAYQDIFWMSRFRGLVQFQNMDISMSARNDSRVFKLAFTWKFGNSKTQYQRKEGAASDELNRIKKD